ncbi:MAG: hypothetical protein MK052_03325, partial [Alphaproteobacteria bacterium]|nr:hypothetical protein [Alphaproteobacteria bacterium]
GLWCSGGKARGSVTGFSPILDAAQTPSTATWYHYAYTFDDATNTQNLYINGTLAQTGTTNSSIDYNNSPLSLGVEFEQPGGANPQYHLNGLMDDVRIYDNALTATNISELYGNFFTVAGIEKMSTTADVAIQATNSITLDLQGDTLDMANDRNLSLTTTSGDILTASAGKITTNRTGTGGNVTFDAGRDILFNHAIDIEAQNGGDVSFKANRHIVMGAGGTIESLSNPLNTVFWSDADADNEGAIRLVGNTINSLGGDVIMGGGLDDGANSGTASDGRPDNFAQATNVEQKGIFLDATTVQSQAGDILLRGNAAYDVALGEGYYGIRTFNNSVLESTSGDISLIGKTIGKRVIWGMEIRDTTIESQTGDILFDGDAQGTADKVVGVDFFSSDVESTGIGANAGNITLTGNSVGSQDGAGVRFWQQNTYLMTTDGDISITGTSDTGDGVHLARSRLASYGTGANAGNISVTGTGGALGVGIYSFGGIPFQIFNKDGDVTINGTSTATSGDGNYGVALNDYRIYMEGTGSGPDAGTISITGTGGAGVNNNHGVYMFFDKFSYYDLLDNDLIVNGTGGGDGTGTNNHGIYVRTPFDIESTGTGANAGNITFTGTGGTGTTDNYGVKLENGVMKTADSNITITGTGGTGTSNNHGIALINSAELTTTNGDISLTGNAASGTGLYSLTGANVIGDAAMTGDITLSGTSTDLRDIAITSLANITMTATNAMEFTAANINANTLSMTSTAGAITHNSGMLTAPTLNFDAAGIVTANLTSNTVDMGANATGSVLTGLVNGATDQAAADSILGGPGNDPAYTFEGLTIRYAAPAPAGTPCVTRPPLPETPAPETPVLPPVTPTPKPTTPVSPKPNPTPVIATPLTLPNTVVYVSQHPHVGISTTEPGSTNPVKEIGRTTLPASPNAAPESNTDNATDKEEETAVKIKSNKNKLSGLTSGLLRLSPKLAKILGYSKGEVF